MSSELSAQDVAVASYQCIEVVTRLFRHLDRREYDRVSALMTPDGTWQRPDGRVRNGAELTASLAKRPAGLLISHVLTSLSADLMASDKALVSGLMVIFRDDNGANSPLPAKMAPPTALIECAISCRKLGSDWRVHAIDVNYLFKA
jgi:hypothetical protein